MAQGTVEKSAGSALEKVLPWAMLAAAIFALVKLLEGLGPVAGRAAGGAAGGALGGLLKGFGEGLGLAPSEGSIIPAEAGSVLPIPAGSGPSAPTGSILTPPNNGEAKRPIFTGDYLVEINVTSAEEAPAMLVYEVDEYPRLFGAKTVSRKVQAVKLKAGRNLFSWRMPYAVDLLKGAGADLVGKLSVDGRQVASSAYYLI